MVNAGATRGRRVALPAGSVTAVLTSDDGNVRAYLVATPGRLEYVVLDPRAADKLCRPESAMPGLQKTERKATP